MLELGDISKLILECLLIFNVYPDLDVEAYALYLRITIIYTERYNIRVTLRSHLPPFLLNVTLETECLEITS